MMIMIENIDLRRSLYCKCQGRS